MYTLNDFFCGCGGLGLGFQNAGFKIVGAWDFDKYAVATYRENVGDHVVQADIQQMHIEDVPKADVWAFGFPCQDLSVAGKQEGIKLECTDCGKVWEVSTETYSEENSCPDCGGKNHKAATRSGMFFEIMRLVAEAREREPEKIPKVLVAENVKALRKLLPVLEAEYGKAGYKCHAQLFNSKYWGVPQNRERYIVVGTLESLPDTYQYPDEQHDYVPKLSTILEENVAENFYIADEKAQKIIDQALQRLSSMGNTHATITPDRVDKRQNGRRAKEDEDPMFTLTAQDLHGVILRPERTEYGKRIRKAYESGEVSEKWGNLRELQPRPDGISNTLTTVLKDNLLVEEAVERERERERTGRNGCGLQRNGSVKSEQRSENVEGGRIGQFDEETQLPAHYNEKRYGVDAPLFPIAEATATGVAVGRYGDAINIAYPESSTRRGRVGKEVAQSLLTSCTQVVICDRGTGKENNDT